MRDCIQPVGRFSLNFRVNSSAFLKNFLRSFCSSSARSARSGCSGSGSFTSAISELSTSQEATQTNKRVLVSYKLRMCVRQFASIP